MIPDYPHKIFGDKRICYFLLMEALAMEAVDSPKNILNLHLPRFIIRNNPLFIILLIVN